MEKKLDTEIMRLLGEGYESYDDLPKHERDNLLSMCVTAEIFDYICTEELLKKIKAYVVHEKFHHAQDIAHEIKTHLFDLYEGEISQEYDEIKGQMLNVKNIEAGLKPYRDMINGEIRWLKP